MQTKPKQKLTAILIALTMILTTMMQLCIPITVHAEETFNDFTITVNSSYVLSNINYDRTDSFTITRNSYVSARTIKQVDNGYTYYMLALFSDSPFNISHNYIIYRNGTQYTNKTLTYKTTTPCDNGVYHHLLSIVSFSPDCESISINGMPTIIEVGSTYDIETIEQNLDLSKDDYEEKSFDDVATYDESIPTPKFKVEKNLRFDFLNSESDYYYEVKGRWYTTDDFYLHLGGFMNAIWLYDYETIYKNDLTDWITYKDKRNTAITGYLKDIGENSFSDLIKKYPIGTRQITGEKNKDGSYKAGFDHASSNLVMWLKDSTSIYNGIEVYIRYYKIDENGNYTYGKWAHYYNSLAKQSGAEINDNVLNDVEHNYSDKGLTNDELNDLENSGQSKGDTDIVTDYGDNGGGILSEIDKLDEVDFSNVIKVILSLFQQTKAVFNMFTTVLSFMPIWVTELIGVSVVIICLIGIWKALR